MRISDWSSDVCSSDLALARHVRPCDCARDAWRAAALDRSHSDPSRRAWAGHRALQSWLCPADPRRAGGARSEEHTSDLQSLMRISYAVFCLKKKNINNIEHTNITASLITQPNNYN